MKVVKVIRVVPNVRGREHGVQRLLPMCYDGIPPRRDERTSLLTVKVMVSTEQGEGVPPVVTDVMSPYKRSLGDGSDTIVTVTDALLLSRFRVAHRSTSRSRLLHRRRRGQRHRPHLFLSQPAPSCCNEQQLLACSISAQLPHYHPFFRRSLLWRYLRSGSAAECSPTTDILPVGFCYPCLARYTSRLFHLVFSVLTSLQ